MNKILIIGNCQTNGIGKILSLIIPNVNIYRFTTQQFDPEKWEAGGISVDLVVHHDLNDGTHNFVRSLENQGVGILHIPRIVFVGSLPDCIYVSDKTLRSPITYHSFIVVSSFLLGLSENQCYQLFSKNNFKKLGYSEIYDTEIPKLKKRLIQFGLSPNLVDRWSQSGVFMHTINHPKLFVLEDLIKESLDKIEIPYLPINASSMIADPLLMEGPIFPAYLDTLSKESVPKDHLLFKSGKGMFYSLEEFITASYEIYSSDDVTPKRMHHLRFENGGLQRVGKIYHEELDRRHRASAQNHPYKGRPDFCFWKKSISKVDFRLVDPVVSSDLTITKEDKIATAGSCFAQHIAKRLNQQGFNYFVAEQAPSDLPPDEYANQGYGVFSCRYGNIYTTRQLLQLLDRAFGEFVPSIAPWQRPDGRYIDPFRPQVNPQGYATQDEVVVAQIAHLEAVRCMFLELDVFVFTLGLTECWEHTADGAILPLAPGVVGGELDWDRYRFVNFSTNKVKRDMETFLAKLKSINPAARVLLTVSPVPLMATYEKRHVLISTTVSKSILRVVADEVANENLHVFYFPSYEIITGNFNHGAYYKDDLREVRPEGVDHVMRLFIQHCTLTVPGDIGAPDLISPTADTLQQSINTNPSLISDAEMDDLNDIFCDEENLDWTYG